VFFFFVGGEVVGVFLGFVFGGVFFVWLVGLLFVCFFKVEITVKIDDLRGMSHVLEMPQKALSHHDGQLFTQEHAILKISLFHRRGLPVSELVVEASAEILSEKASAHDL